MTKRLAMTAFIAAILGGTAYAAFQAPWYHLELQSFYYARSYSMFELDFANNIVFVIAALVNIYFFARLMFTGLLVLNGGPTSTRTIAWYTPLGAHVQGGFALAAALVMTLLPPVAMVLGEPAQVTKSWGGHAFVGCVVLAHFALFMIARDPDLARTQTWADDAGQPLPKRKRRWIRAAPQERPLVKPPLPPVSNVGGDPFRVSAPTGLAAAIKQPETKSEAPRADDKDAPAPKLLV